MIAWVLVGGRLTYGPALAALPRPALVVAADGGARHAAVLGVKVDAWLGDFDSSQGVELQAPRITYPRAKAATDAELATQWALEHGATELVLLGAFGGRFDHTFALALGAVRLAQDGLARGGLAVTLHSGDEWGRPLLPGVPLHLTLRPAQTFSVLAASPLHGLSVRGARWELEHTDVPLGSGLTLSNEATGGRLTLTLAAGTALVSVLEAVE